MVTQQDADLVFQKLQRGEPLTGDEDYAFCLAREQLHRDKRVDIRLVDRPSPAKVSGGTELRKSGVNKEKPSMGLSKSEIQRYVAAEVAKVKREVPQRPAVRAARKLRELFKSGVPGNVPPWGAAAHKSFTKARGHFGKASERYQDDTDLHDGNAHLGQGVGHLEGGDLSACRASMKNAAPHFERAASRLANDDDVSNGHAHFQYGMQHLSKIDFEGYEGSDLNPRSTADATSPAKASRASSLAKIMDPAFTVGTALCKQAQQAPQNMNPFGPDVPGVPGKPLDGLGDVGGNLFSDQAMARAGNNRAQAQLIQSALAAGRFVRSRY
jgi:hypothetical protein